MSGRSAGPGVLRARRTMGALFLGTFGTLWIMLWAYSTFDARVAITVVVGIVGLCLLGWSNTVAECGMEPEA